MGGTCPRDGEFDVAVERIGQRRVEDHFRAHGGQGARRLGKPHVVADRNAEASHRRNVEDDEVIARSRCLFIGPEGKHFAVSRDDRSARIDDRGGIEGLAAFLFIERARNQPNPVTGGHGLECRFGRTGQRLGKLREWTEGGQFAE